MSKFRFVGFPGLELFALDCCGRVLGFVELAFELDGLDGLELGVDGLEADGLEGLELGRVDGADGLGDGPDGLTLGVDGFGDELDGLELGRLDGELGLLDDELGRLLELGRLEDELDLLDELGRLDGPAQESPPNIKITNDRAIIRFIEILL